MEGGLARRVTTAPSEGGVGFGRRDGRWEVGGGRREVGLMLVVLRAVRCVLRGARKEQTDGRAMGERQEPAEPA